jgi:hypothetical protein
MTRGRTANHLYVPVVGDGDPHTILRPENNELRTATELLQQILARAPPHRLRPRCSNDLADQVCASGEAASRADEQDRILPAGVITDLQVWRAAMQVEPADLRPTGPEQRSLLARTWQRRLNRRLGIHDTPQDQQWAVLLTELIPNLIKDSFLPSLTKRLQLGPRRPRRSQPRPIGSRQSTVTRRPPGSRTLVAHSRRTAPAAANNSHQTTPAVARLNATKPRPEPHRAPQTAPTIGPAAEPARDRPLPASRLRYHKDLLRCAKYRERMIMPLQAGEKTDDAYRCLRDVGHPRSHLVPLASAGCWI